MMSMATDTTDRARSRLSELRGRFEERLGQRLERLEQLVTVARRDPSTGALAEAIGVAHRMAGTAGSYGFVEVGESAAGLERALQRIAGGEDEWEAALGALARARQVGPVESRESS